MNSIMEKVKKNIAKKEMWIFLSITILFLGMFFKMDFSPDTYRVFSQGARDTCLHFLQCGRIITASAFALVHILKFNDVTIYILSFILGIVSMTLSQFKLFNMLKTDIKNKYIAIIVSTLIILNVFSIELMMYIEKGILCLSVLLNICAIEQIKKYFENRNITNVIFSILFMFLANCAYQGTVAIFVIISMIYIIKNSHNFKKFIYNNIIIAIVYAIPAVLNFIMVRFIFGNSRVNGNLNIEESMIKIIDGTRNMIETTYNLLPKGFFITIAIIIVGIIIFVTFRKKESSSIIKILATMYLILGTIIVTIIPQIMQDTNSIWFVPRSTYGYASLLGILIWYLFLNENIGKSIEKLVMAICAIYLVIQYIYCQNLIVNHYIVNYEDRQSVLKIEEIIQEYETKSGNLITKVSIYNDKNTMYTHNEIFAIGDINVKALYPDWSTIETINYYTGRQLEKGEKNKEIEKNFKEKDWKYFSEEQVILREDTLHLCIY